VAHLASRGRVESQPNRTGFSVVLTNVVQQYNPIGMVVDSTGNLYVAANRPPSAQGFTPSGVIGAIAVGGGSGMGCVFEKRLLREPTAWRHRFAPRFCRRNLYVAGGGDRIWKISPRRNDCRSRRQRCSNGFTRRRYPAELLWRRWARNQCATRVLSV